MLKKVIFVFVGFILNQSNLKAMEIGIGGGGSINTATVENLDGSMGFGFQAGGVALFDFSDDMAFRTGLLFAYRTYKYSGTINVTVPSFQAVDGNFTTSFSYIDIPVGVMYHMEQVSLFGGVKVALNMGCSNKLKYNDSFNTEYNRDIDCEVQKKGMVLFGEIGLNYPASDDFNIELFGEFGLGEVAQRYTFGSVDYAAIESPFGFGVNFVYLIK